MGEESSREPLCWKALRNLDQSSLVLCRKKRYSTSNFSVGSPSVPVDFLGSVRGFLACRAQLMDLRMRPHECARDWVYMLPSRVVPFLNYGSILNPRRRVHMRKKIGIASMLGRPSASEWQQAEIKNMPPMPRRKCHYYFLYLLIQQDQISGLHEQWVESNFFGVSWTYFLTFLIWK